MVHQTFLMRVLCVKICHCEIINSSSICNMWTTARIHGADPSESRPIVAVNAVILISCQHTLTRQSVAAYHAHMLL